VLPRYCDGQKKNKKWGSFSRQLQLYGFLRCNTNNNHGTPPSSPKTGTTTYYHELFLRGRPGLCDFMRRAGSTPTRNMSRSATTDAATAAAASGGGGGNSNKKKNASCASASDRRRTEYVWSDDPDFYAYPVLL